MNIRNRTRSSYLGDKYLSVWTSLSSRHELLISIIWKAIYWKVFQVNLQSTCYWHLPTSMKTELVCVECILQTACWGILYRDSDSSFLAKLGAQVWQLLDWIQAGNCCQVLDPWKRLAFCAYTAIPLWLLNKFRGANLYSYFSCIYKTNDTYTNYFK